MNDEYPKPKLYIDWEENFHPIDSSTVFDEIEVALVEGAKLPTRKFETDSGMDFYSNEDVTIPGGQMRIVDTGAAVNIKKGYGGFLELKSRSNFLLMARVIDEPYIGTIKVKIFNPFPEQLEIKRGDAICQMVIYAIATPKPVKVEKIEKESERGDTGGVVTQYKVANLESKITGVD
jgi:dUTP pyrophosphatase